MKQKHEHRINREDALQRAELGIRESVGKKGINESAEHFVDLFLRAMIEKQVRLMSM